MSINASQQANNGANGNAGAQTRAAAAIETNSSYLTTVTHMLVKSNVLVKFLPTSYSQEELQQLFAAHGKVLSCKLIKNHQTGESLGYGFIRFESDADAAKATQALNGMQIGHKVIRVQIASPAGAQQQPNEFAKSNIYIAGLPKMYTKTMLDQVFSSYGTIVESRILVDAHGEPRGIGFVRYDTTAAAIAAINATNNTIAPGGTEVLVVKFARDSRQRSDGMAPSSPPGPSAASPPAAAAAAAAASPSAALPAAVKPAAASYAQYPPTTQQQPQQQQQYAGYSAGSTAPTATRDDYYRVNAGQFAGMFQFPAGYPGTIVYDSTRGAYVPYAVTPSTAVASVGGAASVSPQQPSSTTTSPTSTSPPSSASGAVPNDAELTSDGRPGVCLFIFHLPPEVKEYELAQLFAAHGTVMSCRVIVDPVTRQSRGYGFINMRTLQEAQNAINNLNGSKLGNKFLKVSFKKKKNSPSAGPNPSGAPYANSFASAAQLPMTQQMYGTPVASQMSVPMQAAAYAVPAQAVLQSSGRVPPSATTVPVQAHLQAAPQYLMGANSMQVAAAAPVAVSHQFQYLAANQLQYLQPQQHAALVQQQLQLAKQAGSQSRAPSQVSAQSSAQNGPESQ